MIYLGNSPVGVGIRPIGPFKKVEVHSLTITGRASPVDTLVNNVYTVQHELGETPDFIYIYPKTRYIPGPESNQRVVQFMLWIAAGSALTGTGFKPGFHSHLVKLYDNSTGSKYLQYTEDNRGTGTVINSLTSADFKIGGVAATNTGIFNGDYWVIVGKFADEYLQGEQTVFPT